MRDSVVYVVQDPDGKEILPAQQFGRLQVCLTGNEVGVDKVIGKLRFLMRDITENDYILPIGSPLNIALASHVALTMTGGKISFLVWQRQTYNYKAEPIIMHESYKPTHAATHH